MCVSLSVAIGNSAGGERVRTELGKCRRGGPLRGAPLTSLQLCDIYIQHFALVYRKEKYVDSDHSAGPARPPPIRALAAARRLDASMCMLAGRSRAFHSVNHRLDTETSHRPMADAISARRVPPRAGFPSRSHCFFFALCFLTDHARFVFGRVSLTCAWRISSRSSGRLP